MDHLLTVNDLSKILQISVCTIYRMVHQGEIPFIKIRHSVRFKEREIEVWLIKRGRKGRIK